MLGLLTQAAFAQVPQLGGAASFAVLSAAPDHGGAVTCTRSDIDGDVGSSGPAASVVQTNCTIDGSIVAPVSAKVLKDFLSAYDALALTQCDAILSGTLAGTTLTPGVYCFDAAATLTGTLTLAGDSNDTWLFKIGTGGTGALTGTNFSVVMEGGGEACNVTWWVAQAVTMTDSIFNGNILAGAAITMDRGTLNGDAYAKADVTFTGTAVTGCGGSGQLSDGGGLVCKVKKNNDDHGDGHHEDGNRGDNKDGWSIRNLFRN